MVILMRFNQPVRAADVAPHVTGRFVRHAWDQPSISPEGLATLKAVDPASHQRFTAKVAATTAVANSTAPVGLQLTEDWDRKLYPASRDLVVFETTTEVPPEAWVRLTVAPTVPSPAGPATPRAANEYTIEVEPSFFVVGVRCTAGCAADAANWVRFRGEVRAPAFAAAVHATDITDPTRAIAVSKTQAPQSQRSYQLDRDSTFSLEDAGFSRQPPARTYAVTIDASLRSADGQTLGYTWAETIENWHARAFTSFGDGHGVWERSGGSRLPFYSRNFQNMTQWVQRVEPANLMPTLLALQEPSGQDDQRGAAGAGRGASSAGRARPHPVARPRPVARAQPGRQRTRMGGHARRRSDREGVHLRQRLEPHRRLARAGHQPGDHGQGQPAERARLRHAPG
jgi:hypothetical protein